MTKSDILTLVGVLSLSRNDSSQSTQYLEEELQALAASTTELADCQGQSITAGTSTYTLSSTHLRPLCVFWDSRELAEATLPALNLDPAWKTRKGDPQAYVLDEQSSNQLLLWPEPSRTAAYGTPSAPLAGDFPAGCLFVLGTVLPGASTYIPIWLGFIIALRVCWREFSHLSDHQDIEWAQLCGALAAYLARSCGVAL